MIADKDSVAGNVPYWMGASEADTIPMDYMGNMIDEKEIPLED